MGFKFEEIKAYLMKHGLDSSIAESLHAVYGTQRLGGTANAYFLIVFTETGIYIISITPMGKLGDIVGEFSAEDIQAYQFKKRLFMGYKLKFSMNDKQSFEFNVNKVMIGVGWHKTELQEILEINYYNKRIDS
ncbi:hypothetical protein [Streptococcus sp. CCH8-C6]|uniref:hypothetical protein n=1 Tax=Streptococcus sp. CCH8-C6 TaxID=1768777 RepID=UPI00076A4D7E|nr:hypothetical protein [Streptococcus sp. CCH8-C6]